MRHGNLENGQVPYVSLAIKLLVLAIMILSPAAYAQESNDKVYRIGFHLWKPGKIYDEAMAGIKDGLLVNGVRYEAVEIQSDRNKELAQENLRKLDDMGLDLIYSLSSAGTKLAKRIGMQTPVVATVINHPASLGVSQEGQSSSIQLTGTSYYVEANKQLALYQQVFPDVKKVGMIFDSQNPAGYLAEEPFMRKACNDIGLEFVSIKVSAKSELAQATNQLVEAGIDLMVIPTNRLVYGNLNQVLDITNKQSIPVVSMNKQGIENGALAALFADTYNLGRQAADMAKRIIVDGVDPSQVEYQFIPDPDIILNLKSAKKLGVEFPAEILSQATIVLQ